MKISNFPRHIRKILQELCRAEIDNVQFVKLRELPATFRALKRKCPGWSNYTCFAGAVAKTRKERKTILQNFSKLVPADEYEARDKRKILWHLYRIRGTSK